MKVQSEREYSSGVRLFDFANCEIALKRLPLHGCLWVCKTCDLTSPIAHWLFAIHQIDEHVRESLQMLMARGELLADSPAPPAVVLEALTLALFWVT